MFSRYLHRAIGVVALVALAWLASSDASWFPQEYRHGFYWVKLIVGAGAVLATVYHINDTWDTINSTAREWRYYALLFSILAITAGSQGQVETNPPVRGLNITALIVVSVALYAAVKSIHEDRTRA